VFWDARNISGTPKLPLPSPDGSGGDCLRSRQSDNKASGVNYNQTVKVIKANFGEKRDVFLLNKQEKETTKPVAFNQKILLLSRGFEEKYLIKHIANIGF